MFTANIPFTDRNRTFDILVEETHYTNIIELSPLQSKWENGP